MRIVVVRPFTLSIPLLAARDVQIRMETIAPRITNEVADTTDTCA